MNTRLLTRGAAFAALLWTAGAVAAPVTYTDQASFLADLGALGYGHGHEGFEADAAWGTVRTTVAGGVAAAPAVSNLGITWTANNLSSGITTSAGAARTGLWGVYAYPHGSYTVPDPGTDCSIPGDCGDGLRGQADSGLLYAIGGWFRTNTPYAKVGVYLPAYNGDPEGALLDQTIGTDARFFGVIDIAGFTAFEFRELEGVVGDAKFVFADDFYFGGPGITAIPLPATRSLLCAALGLLGASATGRRAGAR